MLIDNKMLFFEAEPIADGGIAAGTIDLYGQDIITYPEVNSGIKHGRGKGSTILVHVVYNPGTDIPLGGTNPIGNLKIGNSSPALYRVLDVEIPTPVDLVDIGNAGVHYVFAVPYTSEGRYLTFDLNMTGVTGLGAGAVATAWIFCQ